MGFVGDNQAKEWERVKKSSLVKVRVNVNSPSSWEGRCDRKAAAGQRPLSQGTEAVRGSLYLVLRAMRISKEL